MIGPDLKFINPFLDGTLDALKVTCNFDVKPGKAYLKGPQPEPEFDLAAIVGITSGTVSGSITLLFTDAVYIQIVSGWLGEQIVELTQDHIDGVAELLNIIFGSAKVAWNEQGMSVQKAIPTFVRGKPLTIKHAESGPTLVVPFITALGNFHVEIRILGTAS